jgi:hypothetical protein
MKRESSEEKEAAPRGAQYPAYRVPPKAAFCLLAGLKIQRLRRECRRAAEERRGLYSLSDVQKLAGTFPPFGA